LVQGNVDALGRASGASRDLAVHLGLTRDAVREARVAGGPGYDLVVWPEGAVLGYLMDGEGAGTLHREIASAAPGAAFVVGGRAYEDGRSFNSLFSLSDGELLGR